MTLALAAGGSEIIERLHYLHPEMALFAATCVVMVLGLSKSLAARKSAAIVTGLGLIAAAWLSLRSPGAETEALKEAILPGVMPYAKTLIAVMGLLALPMLTGVVDRAYERDVARGRAFDPLRATRGEFYAFFLFSLTGVMLCVTADDLIWIFLALELTSLPTYIMVAMSSGRLRAQEAAVKYFFLGAFSAAIFLYGFALIYGVMGTTSLPEIRNALAQSDELNPMLLLGFILAIVGVSFKIAAVPMHFYTPDVYQGAATSVAGYLAFAPKAAGILVLIMLVSVLGWTHGATGITLPAEIRVTLWVMAALTMTVGNVLALLQDNVKRMLAYSSVAHSGYMLVGLIAGPGREGDAATSGLAAALFYLLSYSVMTLGAFAAIASLEKRTIKGEMVEVELLSDLNSVCRTYPAVGWSLVVCALSLLGMPPLFGFFGKLALFTSAWEANEKILVVVLAINSAVAAFYYLRIAAAALFEERDEFEDRLALGPAPWRRLTAVAGAAGVVGLALFVSPLLRGSGDATQLGSQQTFIAGVDAENRPAQGIVNPSIAATIRADAEREQP